MLSTLIIIAVLTWIGGFFLNGFTLYNIMVIVPIIMFSVRKFGIHMKMSSIVASEVGFLFASTVWRLLFGKFILWKFLVTILIRAIFIIVVVYDDTVYIYKQEERKKT